MNKERRFIPLRLDQAPIKESLAQFPYISYLPHERKQALAKLLEACTPPSKLTELTLTSIGSQVPTKVTRLEDHRDELSFREHAFAANAKYVLTGTNDPNVRLWNARTGRCVRVFEGHTDLVSVTRWSLDQRLVLSASYDHTLRLWDVGTGACIRDFRGHSDAVIAADWSLDQRTALSASRDNTVRLWDVERGRCLRVFYGHTNVVGDVRWGPDQRTALSGSNDKNHAVVGGRDWPLSACVGGSQ